MNRWLVVLVAMNFGLALGGLYLGQRLRRWRNTWASLADDLAIWERDLAQTLATLANPTPSPAQEKLLRLQRHYATLRAWLGYLPYLRWILKVVVGIGNPRRRRRRD